MTQQFDSEHSSIKENNAPLGWGLKLVILAFLHLCIGYALFYLHTDPVSRDAPTTTIQHGRSDGK